MAEPRIETNADYLRRHSQWFDVAKAAFEAGWENSSPGTANQAFNSWLKEPVND